MKRINNFAKEEVLLSNERTMLSYVRTALAFFVAGAVLIRIFEQNELALYSGLICIILGSVFFAFGMAKYIHERRKYRK